MAEPFDEQGTRIIKMMAVDSPQRAAPLACGRFNDSPGFDSILELAVSALGERIFCVPTLIPNGIVVVFSSPLAPSNCLIGPLAPIRKSIGSRVFFVALAPFS